MSFILLLTPTIATLLKDLIFYFSDQDVNDKERQDNLEEYIDNLIFAIDDQTYTNEDQKLIAIQVIFQTYLCNEALFWYYNFSSEMQARW